jgi:hypothetical protein
MQLKHYGTSSAGMTLCSCAAAACHVDGFCHLFIICVFLLPVFSLFLFVTSVRLKIGFAYSILMHCTNNFIILAFYFLSMKNIKWYV